MFRNLSGVLSPVDWESWGELYPERASEADRETIVGIVLAAEGRESAEHRRTLAGSTTRGVLRSAPSRRRRPWLPRSLDLTRAASEDIAADPEPEPPGTSRTGTHRRGPGETITQTRFVIDRESYQDPSPTLNATPILTVQRYLCTRICPGTSSRWPSRTAGTSTSRSPTFRAPRARTFEVGGRTFGLFAHDFRRVPVDAWVELVAERGLAREFTPAEETPTPLVLSQPEFEQAVKQALHDLHRRDLLARNPLLQTRVVRDRAGDAEPDAGTLEALLRDAVDALAEHPRDDKLLRRGGPNLCPCGPNTRVCRGGVGVAVQHLSAAPDAGRRSDRHLVVGSRGLRHS